MLPQMKCYEHDKDIILINLSKFCKKKQRTYCQGCCQDDNIQPCFLDDIPSKIITFSSDQVKQIDYEYQMPLGNIKKIMKSLITLKDELIQTIDQLISSTEELSLKLNIQMKDEQDYYLNLMNNITRTKLDDIAEMLVGNKIRESKIKQIRGQYMQLLLQISSSFKEYIRLEDKTIDEIKQKLPGQYSLIGCSSEYPDEITAIDSNLEKKIIVGGCGKDIKVWRYDFEFMIQENRIITDYAENIKYIKISNDGNSILTACQTFIIKYWVQDRNLFKCKQTFYDYLLINPQFYQLQTFDCSFQLFYCYEQKYIVYKFVNDQEISMKNEFEGELKIERDQILGIQFTTNQQLLMLIFVYDRGFQVCQYNLGNNEVLYQKFQLSDADLLFYPKFPIQDKQLLKITRNHFFSIEFILVIQSINNGQYRIIEVLNKEFINSWSDINQVVLLRNNETSKRIELYQLF